MPAAHPVRPARALSSAPRALARRRGLVVRQRHTSRQARWRAVSARRGLTRPRRYHCRASPALAGAKPAPPVLTCLAFHSPPEPITSFMPLSSCEPAPPGLPRRVLKACLHTPPDPITPFKPLSRSEPAPPGLPRRLPKAGSAPRSPLPRCRASRRTIKLFLPHLLLPSQDYLTTQTPYPPLRL